MTDEQKGTVALVQGERSFESFAAMVDVTVVAAPHRDRKSLRRGVFHNSQAARRRHVDVALRRVPQGRGLLGFQGLWDDVPGLTIPTTLVRGANSAFVNDDDADEFARTAPGFVDVHMVADSGHSVHSDQPRALTDILRGVLTS